MKDRLYNLEKVKAMKEVKCLSDSQSEWESIYYGKPKGRNKMKSTTSNQGR